MLTQDRKPLDLMALRPTRIHQPLAVLAHGDAKVGKTTFATSFPKPIVFDINDGSHQFEVVRFPFQAGSHVPASYQQILDGLDALAKMPHDFQTLVVDKLDDVEGMLWRHVCARDSKQTITHYGWGDGFKVALAEWRVFAAKLDRLRRERGMHIVMTADATRAVVKDASLGASYHRMEPSINDLARTFFVQQVDVIGFLHHERALAQSAGDEPLRAAVATGARWLRVEHSEGYLAGNRYHMKDVEVTNANGWSVLSEQMEPLADRLRKSIQAELARIDNIKTSMWINDKLDGASVADMQKWLRQLQAKPTQKGTDNADAT